MAIEPAEPAYPITDNLHSRVENPPPRSTLNPNLLKAQYAVRGELYNKAVEMAAAGREII